MTTIVEAVAAELDLFADPVRHVGDGPEGVQDVLAALGWDFTSVAADDIAAIAGAGAAVAGTIDALVDGTSEPTDLGAVLTFLSSMAALATQLDDIAHALAGISFDPPQDAGDLAAETLGFLAARHLRVNHPGVYEAGRLLRLIDGPAEAEPCEHVVLHGTDRTARWPRSFERVRLDRLPDLLTDPGGLLGGFFLPGGLAGLHDAGDVEQVVERLFKRLGDLVFAVGGEPSRGLPEGVDINATDAAMEWARSTLRLSYNLGRLGEFGVQLTAMGEHLGGPRLIVTPFGTAQAARAFDNWTLYMSADTDCGPLVFAPGRVHAPTAGAAGIGGQLQLLKNPAADGLALLLGALESTRLELGGFGVAVGASITADGDYDWGPSLLVTDGKLVVAAGDADSFLATLLGGTLEVAFDGHLRWTSKGGLHLEGSGGLTKRFEIDRSIGPVTVTGASLGISPGDGAVAVTAGMDVLCTLGPFAVTVGGTGVAIDLAFPPSGGNLGPLSLGLGLDPPDRVGFAIDSDAVHGGGFVAVDADSGRYSGALALDVVTIGIDAVVVVDTQPGAFSLFASLSARFPGIPLGFGFTLLGAGGLLALNRTLDAEALAGGLRSGAVDGLLFPDDPVGDAAQLIAQIDDYFPLRDGNTVIGPVIEAGWGTPTLITAQLGIVLSLPDGVIAVLGSVSALLPVPEAPLITLHMDALGVVDVGAGTFWVTASLYDSRLLKTIDLGGDMAMYLSAGEQPYFLMSVGGYHPSFHPPSTVPAVMHDLRRMSASVVIDPTVSVVITAYFAVTSNTVQFGASVDLEASVDLWPATYTARGGFDFDVLLQFSPFKIVADMSAGVSISSGGKELMGVDLAAHLEGPEPWYASGLASFRFFGLKVSFDLEVGGKAPGEPRPVAYPRDDVLAALRLPASWREAGPVEGLAAGITYATPEDSDTVWVRPDHQLSALQSIAPFDRTLERVGEAVPAAGQELLDVTGAGISDVPADPVDALDWFAPAQFEVLSGSDRLSRASYEEMAAGVTFGDPQAAVTSHPEELTTSVDTGYEEALYTVPGDSLGDSIRSGAAGVALRAGIPKAPAFKLSPTTYTLVRAADGTEATLALADSGLPPGGVSQADALRARAARIAADPGARSRMVVVPATARRLGVPDVVVIEPPLELVG